MAFKMKGFPMHAGTSAPMKQTPIIGGDAGDSKITDEMRSEKNKVEIAYNNRLAEEGFSTDTNLEGASEELLALKEKFDKLRQPFIKENMEKLEEKKAEGKGLFQMKGWSPFHQEGPVPDKNPKLKKGEHPDTWVYEGSNARERIIDLEDRIEFLTSNELQDDDWYLGGAKSDDSAEKKKKAAIKGAKRRKKIEETVQELRDELAILRRSIKNK